MSVSAPQFSCLRLAWIVQLASIGYLLWFLFHLPAGSAGSVMLCHAVSCVLLLVALLIEKKRDHLWLPVISFLVVLIIVPMFLPL